MITSGPDFTPATIAPLAGLLQLTTDVDTRLAFSVDDGSQQWQRQFYDYSQSHSLPLLGFLPARTNFINVTVYDRSGNQVSALAPIVFVTPSLPLDFPQGVLLKCVPEKMEPGYTLFRLVNRSSRAFVTAVDNFGRVAWYSLMPSTEDVRQLANGDLFLPLVTTLAEVNMLGMPVNSWNAATNLAIDNHEGFPTDHGTLLYLSHISRVVTNFPTSATIPNAPRQTTSVQADVVVEISATNNALLNTWSMIDMLDPTRVDYNTFSFHTTLGWDCEHANAIVDDPLTDSLMVSLRHQDAVVKFSRSGQIKWILGPHENWSPAFQPYLLTPVGTPFLWNYAQHAPVITPQGTLLLYDDGNWRASPFDSFVLDSNNFSRAVEYNINEDTKEVSQVWDFGRTNAERIFTPIVGKAQWLPQRGNVLITYGNITFINGLLPSPVAPIAVMARIQEVTHTANPEVVFDLAYFNFNNTYTGYRGTFTYRSRRIPDLYPVVSAAAAVADLMAATAGTNSCGSPMAMGNLSQAVGFIGLHQLDAAIRRLRTYQFLLTFHPKGATNDIDLLLSKSQGIIDALQAGKTSYASEQFTGILPSFTPLNALANLITEVGDTDCRLRAVLVSFLTQAIGSVAQQNNASAARQLSQFEVLAGLARLDPKQEARFRLQVQRVLQSLAPPPAKSSAPLQFLARPVSATIPDSP